MRTGSCPVAVVAAALRTTRARTTRCRRAHRSASTGSGTGSCEGNHVRTNGTRSPAETVELGDGRHVLAAELDGRVGCRAHSGRRSRRGVVVDAGHPGDDRAVVEADHELRRDLARSPRAPRRSARGPGSSPRGGMKSMTRTAPSSVSKVVSRMSVSRPVAALDPCVGRGRREQPAAVLGAAEQRGEAGARVEPGQAEPVDRARAGDERCRLQVADQRVVLDPHGSKCVQLRPRAASGTSRSRNACSSRHMRGSPSTPTRSSGGAASRARSCTRSRRAEGRATWSQDRTLSAIPQWAVRPKRRI